MTEKEIMKYRSLIRLAERKRDKLDSLWSKDIDTVVGKVKASSKHFPYIETHPTVYMNDPVECEKREKACKQLEKEILDIESKIKEIVDFIDTIEDIDLIEIFELRVYDGMKWNDIAADLGEDKDRTTYSKKFKKYLETSHISPNSHIKAV